MVLKSTILAFLLGTAKITCHPAAAPGPDQIAFRQPVAIAARVGEQPLPVPAHGQAQADFIKDRLEEFKEENTLGIWPPKVQTDSWIVESGRMKIPISATSKWIPFGRSPEIYVMNQLTGCTGIIMLTPHGIWGNHLWESSKNIANAGAFLGYSTPKAQEDDVKTERPVKVFQKIAIDIMGQATPESERQNRAYTSLQDVSAITPDVFEKNIGVFVLTKATGVSDSTNNPKPKPMYAQAITALAEFFKNNFHTVEYVQKTYIGDPRKYLSTVPTHVKGTILIQYTPFQRTDTNGKKIAAAKIWHEDNRKPALFLEWEALKGVQY